MIGNKFSTGYNCKYLSKIGFFCWLTQIKTVGYSCKNSKRFGFFHHYAILIFRFSFSLKENRLFFPPEKEIEKSFELWFLGAELCFSLFIHFFLPFLWKGKYVAPNLHMIIWNDPELIGHTFFSNHLLKSKFNCFYVHWPCFPFPFCWKLFLYRLYQLRIIHN